MRIVFTPAFVAGMLAANGLAGTWSGAIRPEALARWGLSVDSVARGEVWRLLSATFLSHDATMLSRQVPFALAVIGAYEWRRGPRRAAAMFFGLDVAATGVALTALWAVGTATATRDVGMSAGGFGLIGALLATTRRGWVALGAIAAGLVLKTVLRPDPVADLVHLAGLFIGFAVERRVESGRGPTR